MNKVARITAARIVLSDPAMLTSKAIRNIPGIYNYCDRWCDRCEFTSRCRVFKDLEEAGGHDPEMSTESTLDMVGASFAETLRRLEAEMTARGIPQPTEEEIDASAREDEAEREQVRAHPLVQLALRYPVLVDQWWPTERELLRSKADGLLARSETMDDPERIEAEARRVFDALEVIQWYLFQISIKLQRALTSKRSLCMRGDANGSAKVALIGIDRSLAAWQVIKQWCPETTTHQVVIETLAELRTATEREFPRARSFKRPGFDSVRKR